MGAQKKQSHVVASICLSVPPCWGFKGGRAGHRMSPSHSGFWGYVSCVCLSVLRWGNDAALLLVTHISSEEETGRQEGTSFCCGVGCGPISSWATRRVGDVCSLDLARAQHNFKDRETSPQGSPHLLFMQPSTLHLQDRIRPPRKWGRNVPPAP